MSMAIAHNEPERSINPPGWTAWVSRAVMTPPVLIFTLIALRYFRDPAHALTGATLTTPEAFTDTRVEGAWVLTLLAVLLMCLAARQRLWLGHILLMIFMGLTLVARIYGFTHDGTTWSMGNQRIITIVEIVFLVLNLAGFLLQTRLRRAPVPA